MVQRTSTVPACVQAMSRSQQSVAQGRSCLPAHQSNKRPLEAAAGPEVNTARGPSVDSSARTATGVVIPEAAAKAAKHTASSTPLCMSQPIGQAGAPGAIFWPLFSQHPDESTSCTPPQLVRTCCSTCIVWISGLALCQLTQADSCRTMIHLRQLTECWQSAT